MKNTTSKPSRLLVMCLLAVTMCCFTFIGNRSFAQGANNLDKTGKVEAEKLKPPMPPCPDESILTSTYCDAGCATTGLPSAGGVFMCLSTNLSGLGLDPNHRTCDGTGSCDAGNCQFLHIRNLTDCGHAIKEIKITIKQDSPYTKFVICAPFTNYGTTQGGSHYDTLWTITDLSNSAQITSEACNSWGIPTTRVIDFKDLGSNHYLYVAPCDEWTVIICGAVITNVDLLWVGGGGYTNTSSFPNPTVNTTQCPDANSNHGWPGC